MLLLLLNHVLLRALRKIDVYLISTVVNKSRYHYYLYLVLSMRPCSSINCFLLSPIQLYPSLSDGDTLQHICFFQMIYSL